MQSIIRNIVQIMMLPFAYQTFFIFKNSFLGNNSWKLERKSSVAHLQRAKCIRLCFGRCANRSGCAHRKSQRVWT